MKKAAIALDEWKLAIFERHLKAAGYAYVNAGVLMPGTLILKVEIEAAQQQSLAQVVLAANQEAARTGPHQHLSSI